MSGGARALWLATGDAKKRAELERLLRPFGFALRTLAYLPVTFTLVEDARTSPAMRGCRR